MQIIPDHNTGNPAGSPEIKPVESSQPSKSQGDEFGQFKKLTGKLVQVPKSELDELRKGES